MSYNVSIVKQAVPDDDNAAWQHIDAMLGRREQERGLPPDPVFLELIDRLTARFPCICELPEEELEDGVWSDGPLRNNAGHSVTVLGMSSGKAGLVMPLLTETANKLGLTVFDDQGGTIYRPKPHAPGGSKYKVIGATTLIYRVGITGVKDGYTADQVAALLAPLFKRPAADVRPIFDRGGMVVKTGLEHDAAKKYAAILEQRGCVCVILEEGFRRSHSVVSLDGNEESGMDRLRRRAELGDADSQYELGCNYHQGVGFAKDDKQAAQWWIKAAEQKHAKAQFNLSCLYDAGSGVEHDTERALNWCRAAAEQGVPEAQMALGNRYYQGRDVPKHYGDAHDWYLKAAQNGHAPAQYKLVYMHFIEDVVLLNRTEAFMWCRKAAEQGHGHAQATLGAFYDEGKVVKRDYKIAAIWYRKAADQGVPSGQLNLALMYKKGQGVPKDMAQYAFWLRKAAELGDSDAVKLLDRLNRSGGKPFWKLW